MERTVFGSTGSNFRSTEPVSHFADIYCGRPVTNEVCLTTSFLNTNSSLLGTTTFIRALRIPYAFLMHSGLAFLSV
jgi:hypothetical protein